MRPFGMIVAGMVLLVASGCGRVSSLSGIVTLDGQPLVGASIVLTPEGHEAELVTGMTGPDGRFRITPATESGIAPGKYKVTVSKRKEMPPPPKPKPGAEPPEGEVLGANAMILPPEIVPPKYSRLDLSELSVTVPTTGEIELILIGS